MRTPRARFLVRVVPVAIAMVLAATWVSAQTAGPSRARIDDVLRKAVEQKHIPCIVAMVARGDQVIYQGAYGKQTDAATGTVPADAIFRAASMTKTVTSVALMQLVERGRVKLDEPASTYLPELARVQVLDGFDENGKPRLRPPKSAITIRQLLTHTSGFGYEFLDAKLARYVASGGMPTMMTGVGEGWLHAPLLFDPGTAWEYGIGLDWVGKIVEKGSGRSLEDYFRENIFTPLGMADSFFNVPLDKQARVVTVHQRNADGTLTEQPNQFQPVTFFSGGGGLYSTAGDYLKFTRMLLNGGKLGKARILRADTVAMMARNQIGEMQMVLLQSQIPQLVASVNMPGSLDKFGFGFAINTKPNPGGRAAGSMAWDGIFNTFYWIDPQRKTTAVLMMQTLPFLDEATKTVLEDFERSVYAGAASKP